MHLSPQDSSDSKKNPADGGDAGHIYVAARKIIGDGTIQANGGDAAPGGKPGKGGTVTLISDSIEGNPRIEASGGKHISEHRNRKPIYKRRWAIFVEIIILFSAIATIYQVFFQNNAESINSALNLPCSINTNNQSGGKNTVNCDTGLPKPKIDLKPLEINTPNPNSEIGFDSVYLLEINSDYTISNELLKIKMPASVDSMQLDKGWMYEMTETYSPEYTDGYAVFDIHNAGGEYYLVFSNGERVNLTEDDIVY